MPECQPADRLGPVHLVNGTVQVVVPVASTPGNSTNETQVHYVHSAQTATLKICKLLTASRQWTPSSIQRIVRYDVSLRDDVSDLRGRDRSIWGGTT